MVIMEIKQINKRIGKGERGTWRNYQGEKVYHFKGTFDEVWQEYLKLNQQFKNNYGN